MLIGYDGSRAFNKERTGTENYSYQLLRALSKIDSKNQYIVYLRPGIETDKNWPENFQFKAVKWPRLWTQVGLAKQTFKDKLDILFIPAHTSPLIHKPGLKTVVTVHDLGAEYLPKMHQLKQRLYLKMVTLYQLKNATKLIAVSKATREDLIKKVGIPSKNIKVVYEGYNKQLFRPIKGESLVNSLKEFDLKSQEYFLFVGTIQPRKNLERLIEAFSEVVARDFATPKLVLVGSKGWLADSIYELPKKLGVADHVKFLGRVSDEKLPALYSGAIGLVFPSLFEGFGLPILEAFACNCPVVASRVSSLPEVAGDAAIYVDPLKVNDIARGMNELLDSKKRESCRVKGRKQLLKFSWEKCAKETLQILEEEVV